MRKPESMSRVVIPSAVVVMCVYWWQSLPSKYVGLGIILGCIGIVKMQFED